MLTSSTWISGWTLDAVAFHIFHLLFSCEMLHYTLHYPLRREVISVRKCPVLNAALASQPWRAGRRAHDSWNSTEASARVRYGPTCASPRHKTKCNDSNETGRIMSHHVASLFAKHIAVDSLEGNHVISSDYTCSGTSECSTSAEADAYLYIHVKYITHTCITLHNIYI